MGGDANAAEASYREAIRLQPDYAQAHANLAILLFQKDRVAEASYHFERAIRLQPDYAYGRFNYGLMLVKTGRTTEAKEQLSAALKAAKPSEAGLQQAAVELLRKIGNSK